MRPQHITLPLFSKAHVCPYPATTAAAGAPAVFVLQIASEEAASRFCGSVRRGNSVLTCAGLNLGRSESAHRVPCAKLSKKVGAPAPQTAAAEHSADRWATRRMSSVAALLIGALLGAELVVRWSITVPLVSVVCVLVAIALSCQQALRRDSSWLSS